MVSRKRRSCWWRAPLVCWTCVSVAEPVAAGESSDRLVLVWSAPSPCPSQGQLESQVRDLIGTPTEAAARVEATADAWRGEDALWHVAIRTKTGTALGERRVDGESCDAVAQATALILAMSIDPEAVSAKALGVAPNPAPLSWDPSVRPSPLRVLEHAPVVQASPLPAVPPVAMEMQETTWGLVGVVGGVDAGSLPDVSPWIGGVAAVSRGRERMELEVAFLAQQTEHLQTPSSAGGHFDLTTVGLAACHDVWRSSATISLCGGIHVGVMRARGFGVTDPGSADPLWLSLVPSAVGAWPLGNGISLRLEVEGGLPLRRPGFDLEPYGEVHRASPVVARAAFGPQIQFP